MLVPQRRLFTTRDDFQSALHPALAELSAVYASTPVRDVAPAWSAHGGDGSVFHVDLPTDMAQTDRGQFALIRSLLLGLKDKRVGLLEIARVEQNGMTVLWARCTHGSAH